MKKTLSTVEIMISAILWGCIGLFYTQLSYMGFSPLQVVFLRVSSAALMMGGYILVRHPCWFQIKIKDIWIFIGSGVCSLAFFNFCYFSAIELLSPSIAAVMLYTAPIFVMVMSALVFHENITLIKLIAMAMTVLGCGLVTGAFGGKIHSLIGVVLGVGSAIGYALYSIFGVVALRKYHSETITFYTFVFAAIGVLPICRVDQIVQISVTDPWRMIGNTFCIGFFACFLPYLLYTKGLDGTQPGTASVIATLEPIVAAVVGFLFLDDPFTWYKPVGMIVVILAIILINIGSMCRHNR